MALIKMTEQELKDIGINGQTDIDLDLANGVFYKKGWVLAKEDIANDGTEFINQYHSAKYNTSIFLKQIQSSSTLLDGISYNNFQFYKEV